MMLRSMTIGGAHSDKSSSRWAPHRNHLRIASKTGTLVLFSEKRTKEAVHSFITLIQAGAHLEEFFHMGSSLYASSDNCNIA